MNGRLVTIAVLISSSVAALQLEANCSFARLAPIVLLPSLGDALILIYA
jgi:hypothetical protein